MAPLVWGDKEQGEQAIKVTGGIKILVLKYSWTPPLLVEVKFEVFGPRGTEHFQSL